MNFNLKKMNYKHLVIPVLLSVSFLSCKKTKAKVEEPQQVQGNYRLESLKVLGMMIPKSLPTIPLLNGNLDLENIDQNTKKIIVHIVNELSIAAAYAGEITVNAPIYNNITLKDAYHLVNRGDKSKLENLVNLINQLDIKEPLLAVATWKYSEEDQAILYTEGGVVKKLDTAFFMRLYRTLMVLMAHGSIEDSSISLLNMGLIGLNLNFSVLFKKDENGILLVDENGKYIIEKIENLLPVNNESFSSILENAPLMTESLNSLVGGVSIIVGGIFGINQDLLAIFLNENSTRAEAQLTLTGILEMIDNVILGTINSLEFRFPEAQKMGIWGMAGSELLPFDITWKSPNHLYGRAELPIELSPVEAAIYLEMKKIAHEGDNLSFKLHDVTGGLKTIEYVLALLAKREARTVGSEKIKQLAQALKGKINNKTIMTERPGILAVQILYDLNSLDYLLSFINENLVTFNLIKN